MTGPAPSPGPSGYDPAHFDRLVRVEDRHFWFTSRNRLLARVLGGIQLRPRARVLEIGTGTGNTLRVLETAWPGAQIVGVDLFARGACVRATTHRHATGPRGDRAAAIHRTVRRHRRLRRPRACRGRPRGPATAAYAAGTGWAARDDRAGVRLFVERVRRRCASFPPLRAGAIMRRARGLGLPRGTCHVLHVHALSADAGGPMGGRSRHRAAAQNVSGCAGTAHCAGRQRSAARRVVRRSGVRGAGWIAAVRHVRAGLARRS